MSKRVFVYEYTCAHDLAADPFSAALHAEGWAMLAALLEDFARAPGVEILALLGEHCKHDVRGAICQRIRAAEEERAFRQLAAAADFTIVIAPETDGILRTRCHW